MEFTPCFKLLVPDPDAVLRVEPQGNAGFLQALNIVANQWDPLFCDAGATKWCDQGNFASATGL